MSSRVYQKWRRNGRTDAILWFAGVVKLVWLGAMVFRRLKDLKYLQFYSVWHEHGTSLPFYTFLKFVLRSKQQAHLHPVLDVLHLQKRTDHSLQSDPNSMTMSIASD